MFGGHYARFQQEPARANSAEYRANRYRSIILTLMEKLGVEKVDELLRDTEAHGAWEKLLEDKRKGEQRAEAARKKREEELEAESVKKERVEEALKKLTPEERVVLGLRMKP